MPMSLLKGLWYRIFDTIVGEATYDFPFRWVLGSWLDTRLMGDKIVVKIYRSGRRIVHIPCLKSRDPGDGTTFRHGRTEWIFETEEKFNLFIQEYGLVLRSLTQHPIIAGQ